MSPLDVAGHEKTIVSGGATLRYRGGRLHCADGPAIIYSNGAVEYWFDGERHRDPAEGPAVIHPDGTEYYFVHGRMVSRPVGPRQT